MELSLLFDQTFPPYTMTVGEATALLLDAMEVPSGQNGGTPTAAPPFITFRWGKLKFKGAMHEPHLRVQAVPPEGEPIRADVKLSLKQAGEPVQGPEPDHARAGRLRHAHASRTATRCPRSPTAPTATRRSWRLIAEANGVDNPMHLRRGSSLSLPTLEN